MRTSPFRCALLAAALAFVAAPAGAQSTAAARPDEAGRVRFLIVADTDAKEGGACALDAGNIRAVLEAGLQRQKLEGRYTIDTFMGRDVTPARILNYYRRLKPAPDEALVFFYAGHGAYHSKKGHLLTLMQGDLSRAALLAAMQKLQPRLAVLLTDCCAILDDPPPAHVKPAPPGKRGPAAAADAPPLMPAHPPRPKNYVPPPAAGEELLADEPHPPRPDNWRPPPPVIAGFQGYVPGKGGVTLYGVDGPLALQTLTKETDGEVLRHLFYRHRGVVDINGCQKGKGAYAAVAWGGGLFTSSFLSLQRDKAARFDGNRNGTVEWSEFFPQLQARCDRSASALTKGKIRQLPEATHLGQPVLTVAAR